MEQTVHLASGLFRSSQWKGRGLSSGRPPTGERPSTGCVASSGHASPWAFPRAVALPSPTDAAPNALWALTHRAMRLPRVFDPSTPKQGSLGLSTYLPVMGLTYFSGGHSLSPNLWKL